MKSKEARKRKYSQGSFNDGGFYKGLLDLIKEAVLVADKSGTILYVNDAAGDLFNKPKQEILDESIEKFLSASNHEEVCISRQDLPDKTCRLSRQEMEWGKTIAEVYTLQEITNFKKTELLLSKRSAALTERVKELNALYRISRLTANKEIGIAEVLQKTSNILARSWQYPAVTQAKITWGNQSFKSKNYQATSWKQIADIIVNERTIGNIEVSYQKEMPPADEGPFLKDERKLIEIVADKLGKYLERKDARSKIEFHSKLLNSIGEAVISTDINGKIHYWNKSAERIYGWTSEEVIGKNIIDKTPAAMKNSARSIIKEILQGKTWSGEFMVENKDGQDFNIMITNAPLLDEKNKIIGIIGISRDITERRKAETASRDFAERLNNVANNLPGAIFQFKITPEGERSLPFVSGNTELVYGYPPVKLMENPDLSAEMVHPDDRQRYQQEILESYKNLKPYSSEHRIIRPDGKTSWIEVKSNPKKLENGDVIWTGVALNITDIKTTEQLLLKSEQIFYDVSENIPGLVFQFVRTDDKKYKLNYASKSAEQLLGRKPEDLKNTKAQLKLIHPDDLDDILKSIELSAKNLTSWTKEFRVKTGDNKYIWIQAKAFPHRQADTQIIWNGVMIDVTEQKNAEIRIRESEEKLQEAQRIADLGNFELDIDTRKMIWSDEIFKLMELEHFSGTPVLGDFKNMVAKNDQWKINHYINIAVKTKKRTSFDIKILLPNNRIRYLQIIGKPIFNENEEVNRIRGTVMDITDRKKHEIELNKAKEKAEESDRLKSIFLQTMSHELRTPLNAIIGFSDLLVSGYADSEQQEEFISLINSSGKHLLSIIEDLFEISALETGQRKANIEKIKLPTFINEIIPTIEQDMERLDKQKLELHFKPDPHAPGLIFESDKSMLSRVLINLLNNALKFTVKGKIEFGYEKTGNDLLFFVKDTGIGIPEDKQELIFERFRQAEESPTRTFEGVGLGLSICMVIAELLNAKIWVNSKAGEGSAFYFKLKNVVFNDKITKPEKLNKDDQNALHGKKILVVEDELSNMKLLEIILKRKGLFVIKARNGEEALELFQTTPSIDLVLMDLKMPVMNGFDATREIRKINDNVPVIALTAYAMEGDRQKAIQAGCVDYISKPLNSKTLIQKIEQHLSNQL